MDDFTSYQNWTRETAIYNSPIIYPALLLPAEVGEALNIIQKSVRDNKGIISPTNKIDLERELGDVLWALARLIDDLGLDFSKVKEYNIMKLEDRKARNVIGGSGDNR